MSPTVENMNIERISHSKQRAVYNTLSGDTPECTGWRLLFIVADVYFTEIFIPTKELYVMQGVINMENKPSYF